MRAFTVALLALPALLVGCGGGGGGGNGAPMPSDDARRAVLADIGEDLILPALRDFDALASDLASAVAAHAADPADASALAAAQSAWRLAMTRWETSEALQIGPAAASSERGGEDRRAFIYAYPERQVCLIDQAAQDDAGIDSGTRIDIGGLGALEYLLFSDGGGCSATPSAQQRANYAVAVADFVASNASDLRGRWEADSGNFIGQWSNAGLSGSVYNRPQQALDALTTALFYVEKQTSDRKVACPTGIGAVGLSCNGADVTRVEFPYARHSTAALEANLRAFRDAFVGDADTLGINDLLRGIGRGDIADKLEAQLELAATHLSTRVSPDFETEVEGINDHDACLNASSAARGGNTTEPDACALHGFMKAALDTFRTEVVAALSLSTPDGSAGDND